MHTAFRIHALLVPWTGTVWRLPVTGHVMTHTGARKDGSPMSRVTNRETMRCRPVGFASSPGVRCDWATFHLPVSPTDARLCWGPGPWSFLPTTWPGWYWVPRFLVSPRAGSRTASIGRQEGRCHEVIEERRRYLEFARYLVDRGVLNEGWDESQSEPAAEPDHYWA